MSCVQRKKYVYKKTCPTSNTIDVYFKSSSPTTEEKFCREVQVVESRHNEDSQIPSANKAEICDNIQSDVILLSPTISKKRKKFYLPEETSPKSPSKKFRSNSGKAKKYLFIKSPVSSKSLDDKNEKHDIENNYFEEKFFNNGKLLCFLMKKIISEVTERQKELEKMENIENLITDKDVDVLEKFYKLEETASKVYIRLLCRTKSWYRLSSISFYDVTNVEQLIEKLDEIKFVESNIEKENLETQMQLLKRNELQELCKLFNIPIKLVKPNTKANLITALIKRSGSQRSVLNMLQKKEGSLGDLLKVQIKNYLGKCFRTNEAVKSVFIKIMFLFSFPHYFDEEEKRFRDQLYMLMSVYKNTIKFPNYKLCPTAIFRTQEDFEQYRTALACSEKLENALASKNYEEFLRIAEKVEEKFNLLLQDKKYQERFNSLESFLKKFSAGYIYARLLTKFCWNFKSKTDCEKIIKIAQILLAQNLFLMSKRGQWYEMLFQAYYKCGKSNAAAETLIKAHNDSCLDDVQKLKLQLRGQALLKKKTKGISDKNLKGKIGEICTISILEPLRIEITGKALEQNKTGFKSVYIENTINGKMYSSVEERALLHYKRNGYPRGYHVEGYFIQTFYGLLFFDIIFGESPTGVFQSLYQEAPLDFYYNSFYKNRKSALDLRLAEMCDWTEEELEKRIKSNYYENINTACFLILKEQFTPELLCELANCIKLPTLAKMLRKFVENFKIARSGFPDLTLWNPETQKFKFVEVKSPHDKLSAAQMIWLDFLKMNGIDCEVCSVKNIARKLDL